MIRDRTGADVNECVRLLLTIHRVDGYPIYLPDDLTTFLASGDELGAWVASMGGTINGHIALHRRSWSGVMDVAMRALKCSDNDIAVVARLFVAPSARRVGTGRALLAHATRMARRAGRIPVLDVAAKYGAAIALYDAAGWQRIGTAPFPMPDGSTEEELVFVAPEP